MKMIFRNIGLMLLGASPLFSALLTHDLEVISPTGIPLSHGYHERVLFTPGSSYAISIRLIETPLGVLLVREHTMGGVVQLSHAIFTPGANLIIFNPSSEIACEEDMMNKNVILE